MPLRGAWRPSGIQAALRGAWSSVEIPTAVQVTLGDHLENKLSSSGAGTFQEASKSSKLSPGGVQKASKRLQIAPQRHTKAPSCAEEAPKRCQVAPKRRPRGAKLQPKGSKWAPRGAQETPSWLQEAPKRLQVGSKRRLRGSKLSGKGLQGTLGEHQGGFRRAFEGQNVKTTIFDDSTALVHGFCCIRRALGMPKWSPSCAWKPV